MANRTLTVQFRGGTRSSSYGQSPTVKVPVGQAKQFISRMGREGYRVTWSSTSPSKFTGKIMEAESSAGMTPNVSYTKTPPTTYQYRGKVYSSQEAVQTAIKGETVKALSPAIQERYVRGVQEEARAITTPRPTEQRISQSVVVKSGYDPSKRTEVLSELRTGERTRQERVTDRANTITQKYEDVKKVSDLIKSPWTNEKEGIPWYLKLPKDKTQRREQIETGIGMAYFGPATYLAGKPIVKKAIGKGKALFYPGPVGEKYRKEAKLYGIKRSAEAGIFFGPSGVLVGGEKAVAAGATYLGVSEATEAALEPIIVKQELKVRELERERQQKIISPYEKSIKEFEGSQTEYGKQVEGFNVKYGDKSLSDSEFTKATKEQTRLEKIDVQLEAHRKLLEQRGKDVDIELAKPLSKTERYLGPSAREKVKLGLLASAPELVGLGAGAALETLMVRGSTVAGEETLALAAERGKFSEQLSKVDDSFIKTISREEKILNIRKADEGLIEITLQKKPGKIRVHRKELETFGAKIAEKDIVDLGAGMVEITRPPITSKQLIEFPAQDVESILSYRPTRYVETRIPKRVGDAYGNIVRERGQLLLKKKGKEGIGIITRDVGTRGGKETERFFTEFTAGKRPGMITQPRDFLAKDYAVPKGKYKPYEYDVFIKKIEKGERVGKPIFRKGVSLGQISTDVGQPLTKIEVFKVKLEGKGKYPTHPKTSKGVSVRIGETGERSFKYKKTTFPEGPKTFEKLFEEAKATKEVVGKPPGFIQKGRGVQTPWKFITDVKSIRKMKFQMDLNKAMGAKPKPPKPSPKFRTKGYPTTRLIQTPGQTFVPPMMVTTEVSTTPVKGFLPKGKSVGMQPTPSLKLMEEQKFKMKAPIFRTDLPSKSQLKIAPVEQKLITPTKGRVRSAQIMKQSMTQIEREKFKTPIIEMGQFEQPKLKPPGQIIRVMPPIEKGVFKRPPFIPIILPPGGGIGISPKGFSSFGTQPKTFTPSLYALVERKKGKKKKRKKGIYTGFEFRGI